MKNFIVFLSFLFVIVTNAQVGVNTTNPKTLFVVDGMKDNNDSGMPTIAQTVNDLSIDENGKVGIGFPPLSLDAKLNVKPNNNSASVLKLYDITDSESDLAAGNGVNYNRLSELLIDDNGNLIRGFNTTQIFPTAQYFSFDGEKANVGTSNVSLITSSPSSIIRFDFLTNFKYGAGSAYLVAGTIIWSLKDGFKVVSHSVTATSIAINDIPVVVGSGTQTLTFNFASDADLIFTTTGSGDTKTLNVKMSSIPYGTSSVYFFNTKKFN